MQDGSRTNSAATEPYLTNPDYYRLGYQLSAQLLNREHAQSRKRRAEGGPGHAEAAAVAEEVLASARQMCGWYREREAEPAWKRWKRLSKKEKRLKKFLTATVEPCLHLIIAAAPAKHRLREVDLDLLRRRADKGDLSYRAVYNLACHEAAVADDMTRALAYLQLALRLARSDRRRELAKWAARDPSLESLREEPEFGALLEGSGALKRA